MTPSITIKKEFAEGSEVICKAVFLIDEMRDPQIVVGRFRKRLHRRTGGQDAARNGVVCLRHQDRTCFCVSRGCRRACSRHRPCRRGRGSGGALLAGATA
jgi:hypothetical protein